MTGRLLFKTVWNVSLLGNVPRRSFSALEPKSKRTFIKKLFLGSGLAFCGYQAVTGYSEYVELKEYRKKDHFDHPPESLVLNDWQFMALKKFPTRIFSRLWGQMHEIILPRFLRVPVLSSYAWMFDCNLDEMAIQDLKDYENLNQFFTRKLLPTARPIDDSLLVSPADGRVLYHGDVSNSRVEAVKGITYDARKFLGEGGEVMIPRPGYKMKQITIYLSPGDYHRYHSPTSWTIKNRKHFPGELWSVAPGVVRVIDGLFNYNERATVSGTWLHGYFSFTAVGAYNVGSISYNFDPELITNKKKWKRNDVYEKQFDNLLIDKGKELGMFRLGSTVVLIFEAPVSFEFSVKEGEKVVVGQSLGR